MFKTDETPAASLGYNADPLGANAFTAQFTDQHGRLAPVLLLALALFWGAWASAYHEDTRTLISNFDPNAPLWAVTALFCGLLALILVDILMMLLTILRGRPALVIDEQGIGGHYGGLWVQMAWDDVSYVYRGYGQFCVVRKPLGPLAKMVHAWSKPGRSRKWEWGIFVPLKRIDRSEAQIRAAIAQHRPDLADGQMGKLWGR